MFRARIKIFYIEKDETEMIDVIIMAHDYSEAMKKIIEGYQDSYIEIIEITDFREIATDDIIEIDSKIIDSIENSIENW